MIHLGLGEGGDAMYAVEMIARSSLVLVVALSCAMVLWRRSAAVRHLVWATAIVGVLALPVAQPIVPEWQILPSTLLPTVQGVEVISNDSGRSTDRLTQVSDPVTDERGELRRPAFETATSTAETPFEPSLAMETESREVAALPDEPSTSITMTTSPNLVVGEVVNSPSLWAVARWFCGVAWLTGVAICGVPILLGMTSVWSLRRSSRPAPRVIEDEVRQLAKCLQLQRRVVVVLSEQRHMPMTWGVFVPVLLLPAAAVSWSMERRRMVLLHELAHIRRWDCLTQLLGQLARAVHWFNPLAWLALYQLRSEQERACDDVVLNHGASPVDYASELLSVTARLPRSTWDGAVALAMSRTSRIEQRLNAILDARSERRPLSVFRVIATTAFMTLVAFGIATAQPDLAEAGMPIVPQVPSIAATVQTDAPEAKKTTDAKSVSTTKNELRFDNGDFEAEPVNGLPPSWSMIKPPGGARFANLTLDDVGHGGNRSVSIAIDKSHPMQSLHYHWAGSPHGWKPGQALEISAWVKTENVTASPALAVQCWGQENKYLSLSTSEEKYKVTGTSDWTRIAALVLVPADTELILVRAVLIMPGNPGAKASFDDFAITEADPVEARTATKLLSAEVQAFFQQSVKRQVEDVKAPHVPQNALLNTVLEKIAEVSPNPVNPQTLNEGAIRGMLQSLNDPYSSLVTAEQMKEFQTQMAGKLVGIGVSLATEADEIVVTSLLPNSPAMRSGMKPRDVLVEINGQPAKNLAAAVTSIRGAAGTDVTLRIRRSNNFETVTLKRGEVRLPSVKGLLLDEQGKWRHWLDPEQKIAYVQLTVFDGETHGALKEILIRLQQVGVKGLVLDLRGNVGGGFVPCVEVARLILKEGKIVQVRGRQTDQNWSPSVEPTQASPFSELPLVVLIDHTTASAAEMLAAALKDNHRAILIGERTFGKGSVQSILPVGNEGLSLKLTTAQMFSPSGQPWHRFAGSKVWGVDPHDGYFVTLTAEQRTARQTAQLGRDTGMLKLPELLTPALLDREFADPQLAAGLKSMLAKLKTGEFVKSGGPLTDQQALLTQREDLRKQRDELRQKLEQLDRELGDSR